MNITTEPYEEEEDNLISPKHEIWIGILCVVCALTSILGAIGNGLVIYFAHSHKSQFRTFRYLNKVVQQLAVTNFLYSILAAPLQMVYFYQGKIQY